MNAPIRVSIYYICMYCTLNVLSLEAPVFSLSLSWKKNSARKALETWNYFAYLDTSYVSSQSTSGKLAWAYKAVGFKNN